MPTRRFQFFSALLLSMAVPNHGFATETKSIDLGKLGQASVTAEDEDGARLLFQLPNGKTQKETGLGEEFLPFRFGDVGETRIEARDLDGDGQEEVVVRTKLAGSSAGALYVFRWRQESGRFEPATGEEEDDFLYVSAAAPVAVDKTGLIGVKEEKTTLAYQLKGDRFLLKPAAKSLPAAGALP